MKPLIYATGRLPASARSFVEENCAFRHWDGAGIPPITVLASELAAAEGLILTGGVAGAQLLDLAPQLKVIANIGVGYDNIDTAACRIRGVLATNTPSVLDDSVADLVLGLLLSTTRRIAELDKAIRAGGWLPGDAQPLYGRDLSGTTLGVIGMGRVGEAVAKRARLGFNMDILYHNRSRRLAAEAAFNARFCTLDRLLDASDHVVLLAPLSAETRGMMGAAQFAKMKPTATFINASRGATVDEAALIAALQTGVIRAAGLDVFACEPTEPDNPLLLLQNVTLTPHIGSATADTRERMALRAARNAVDGALGRRPPDVVPELR